MARRLHVAVAAVLFSLFVGSLAAAPSRAQTLMDFANSARNAGKALFGSSEFRSASLMALPHWRGVLAKTRAEKEPMIRCLASPQACASPTQRAWSRLMAESAQLSKREKLHNINAFINRWPHKLDHELYGRREYWASPSEFMARSGDCEDYAIAKFFALRQLGFANEELRIVILWDEIRAIGHAVLAVYLQDEILILDNLSQMITSHGRYRHYIPQYSMNETTRWAHVHEKKIPTLMAKRS